MHSYVFLLFSVCYLSLHLYIYLAFCLSFCLFVYQFLLIRLYVSLCRLCLSHLFFMYLSHGSLSVPCFRYPLTQQLLHAHTSVLPYDLCFVWVCVNGRKSRKLKEIGFTCLHPHTNFVSSLSLMHNKQSSLLQGNL